MRISRDVRFGSHAKVNNLQTGDGAVNSSDQSKTSDDSTIVRNEPVVTESQPAKGNNGCLGSILAIVAGYTVALLCSWFTGEFSYADIVAFLESMK